MDVNYLFRQIFIDLKSKVQGDYYQKVKACALLRQLFLDAHPLAHQVSKQFNFKISFEVDITDLRVGHEDHLMTYVNIEPHDGTIKVPLGKYLNFACIKLGEDFITVGDIIKGASHFEGGVHSGKPSNKKEEMVYQMFQNGNWHHLAIESIIDVAIKALTPLDNLITGNTPAGGF